MKARHAIVMIVAAAHLSGCAWVKEQWPWASKEVPVTRQAETTGVPSPEEPTTGPSTEPQEVPVVPPSEVPDETKPARTQPSVPATAPTTGRISIDPTDRADPQETVVVSGTLYRVNNQFVSVNEILLGLHPGLSAIPANVSEQTFRSQALRMIREEIPLRLREGMVLREAEKNLTDPQKEWIDAEMKQTLREMIAQAGGSTKLDQDFAGFGMDIEDVFEEHRRRLMIRTYLRAKLLPLVTVNRRLLWEYYRKHPSQFSSPRQVRMQIIATPFAGFLAAGVSKPTELELYAAKVKAKEHITKVVKALVDGADFGEVAGKMSRGLKAWAGDDPPLIRAGSFVEPKVEDAAFELEPGKTRGVIETETGYYIVKTISVKPGETVSFEEAQEEIDEIVRKRQFDKVQDRYFTRLWSGAVISPPQDFVDAAVKKAVERYRGEK